MNFLTECLNKIDGDFLITSGREFHKTGPKQLLDSCFIFKLLSLFLLSRASDNTTSQNIGGTDAWAVSHLKFCWGTFPPVPLGLRPWIVMIFSSLGQGRPHRNSVLWLQGVFYCNVESTSCTKPRSNSIGSFSSTLFANLKSFLFTEAYRTGPPPSSLRVACYISV